MDGMMGSVWAFFGWLLVNSWLLLWGRWDKVAFIDL
jgi:hypothetical protein